jgi:hypothetical protein
MTAYVCLWGSYLVPVLYTWSLISSRCSGYGHAFIAMMGDSKFVMGVERRRRRGCVFVVFKFHDMFHDMFVH